ncbi:MAG: hypothetical protein LBE14_07375 [Treponema sp.]|jgi:hypothetical protein|nr:hypothetical protein [Treponema sp.]
MKIKERFSSVTGIFILYILCSLAVIMGFRFLFPERPSPLGIFANQWRLINGILTGINLFPALVFSALIIPFGVKDYRNTQFSKFSPQFLDMFKVPIITAISAVVVYGILFLLVLPVVRDYEATMYFQGRMFRLSKDRAAEYAAREEWFEAAQFIAYCERIWPESPETAALKTEISINYDEYLIITSETLAEERYHIQENPPPGPERTPGDRVPVDAAEALALAETALAEKRYYDAHWLATLGGRLARTGSTEKNRAAILASSAWNQVAALMPNVREAEAYTLYRIKRDGYEAMVSGDWIRGYYIFRELSGLTPADPDVVNFLTQCEAGVAGIAFFTDELKITIGEILTDAVFSFPGRAGGRGVARISSLSAFPDFAYGVGLELLFFDAAGGFSYKVEAPYVKILPIQVQGKPQLVFLMRALERQNKNVQWTPVWTGARPELGNDEVVLDIRFEDFFLMTRARRGVENLFLGELFNAAKSLENYGYIPQVFEAEILRRVFEPLVLFPLTILVIISGWRLRAQKQPRYMGFPMLCILPVVFNGFVYVYRYVFDTLEIGMVLTLGFTLTGVLLIAGILIFFILALILLAAQHG